MLRQSQAFPTEKSQILSGFFDFQKPSALITQNFRIWLQNSQIRVTPVMALIIK